MTIETMMDWYGLKDGHKDFFIENDAHAELLFARSQLDEDLQARLRRSFRSGNPPKFVLYGDWGVGKTHTMRHVEYAVKTNAAYKARIVFVELPDIEAKSTFQVAHAALLDALGLQCVKNWMVQFQTKNQSKSQEIIQHHTQSEDIARAFQSLIGFGEGARICWDWLRGIQLSSADARSVGLSPVLSQSNQLVNVLRMLGRLSSDIDGNILVLMLDEGTTLQAVTNADSIAHWVKAFKILSDQLTKELGFIVSGSWRDPDDMPDALHDEQIQSRFGVDNYIQLKNFDEQEVREFVMALLDEWIDPEKRSVRLKQYAAEAEGEKCDEKTFPFTQKALEKFVTYACRNGNYSRPRDVQHDLDKMLNRAIDDQRHMLSGKYLDSVVAAG